jgi:hypothetical protein
MNGKRVFKANPAYIQPNDVPETSLYLNNDVTMEDMGCEAMQYLEDRGLWGLGEDFPSP